MLAETILDFSIEMRRAAEIAALPIGKAGQSLRNDEDNEDEIDIDLVRYFDEFVGERTTGKRGPITRVWRHGSVVKELRSYIKASGERLKSVEVDLVIETKNEILLYEVKTGSDPQSLYTAIGQLAFHGAVLQEKFPRKTVTRHLVLPVSPVASKRQKFCKTFGLKLITFVDSGKAIEFSGPF